MLLVLFSELLGYTTPSWASLVVLYTLYTFGNGCKRTPSRRHVFSSEHCSSNRYYQLRCLLPGWFSGRCTKSRMQETHAFCWAFLINNSRFDAWLSGISYARILGRNQLSKEHQQFIRVGDRRLSKTLLKQAMRNIFWSCSSPGNLKWNRKARQALSMCPVNHWLFSGFSTSDARFIRKIAWSLRKPHLKDYNNGRTVCLHFSSLLDFCEDPKAMSSRRHGVISSSQNKKSLVLLMKSISSDIFIRQKSVPDRNGHATRFMSPVRERMES